MAQFNTFYIPMDDDGAMAERMNAFLRGHRVLSVRQRDFPEGWGFCVEWIDGEAARSASAPYQFPYQREKVDYMKVLSPDEFKRFSEYRKRRKEIAEADGVKPFVVMTDAQMAELAKMENPTKADLKKIDGFGEARVEKYGERILAAKDATEEELLSLRGVSELGSLGESIKITPQLQNSKTPSSESNESSASLRLCVENNAQNCRSANRNNNNPSNNNNNIGFRLCCSAAPQDSENRAVPVAVQFASCDEYKCLCEAGRRIAGARDARPYHTAVAGRPPYRAERHAGLLLSCEWSQR